MNQEDAYRCPLRGEEQASLLLDYFARKLDEDRRRALDHHMEVCPECAAFRDSQAVVWNALDEWESSPVARSFDDHLADRIAKADRDPLWMRAGAWIASASWVPAVPALAAGALWIMLFQPALPPPADSMPDMLEPEQVERVLEDLDMLRQIPL